MVPGEGLPVRTSQPADTTPFDTSASPQRVLEQLALRLGAKRYALFFDGKASVAIDSDTVTIAVASQLLVNWMAREFRVVVQEVVRDVVGERHVEFRVDPNAGRQAQSAPAPAPAALPVPPAGKAAPAKPAVRPYVDNTTRPNTLSMASAVAVASAASIFADYQPPTPRQPAPQTATRAAAPHAATRTPVASATPAPVRPAAAPAPAPVPSPAQNQAPGRGRRPLELADLVVGPGNELAATAARQVCGSAPVPFNPLYVFGGVGTGKTHILEGISRQLKRQNPALSVLLISAESFANAFTQALRDKSLPSFRQKFRSVDVLLVDDVEFLDGTKVIREEFLHTFCDLTDRGRQVIVSADRHPRLLANLGEELVSRFVSGLVCRLEAPDAAMREQIIKTRASRMQADVSPEALAYVGQRFKSNVREIEGALNCLQTYHLMTGQRVTLAQAKGVLADLERDCFKAVRLSDIEETVCRTFGVKAKDLKSASRTRTVSHPRMIAMYLARKHTQAAYQDIGDHFGGRNHSTVMSAEKKIADWLADPTPVRVAGQDWKPKDLLESLEQQLLVG